jgi:hypothetical protein
LLRNVTYVGQVRHQGQYYPGEHAALVDQLIWEQVQTRLRHPEPRTVRQPSGALLQGKLRCAACGTAMTPAYTARHARRYAYYVCTTAQRRGWSVCPSKSLPAGAMEQQVLTQLAQYLGPAKAITQHLVPSGVSQELWQAWHCVRQNPQDCSRQHAWLLLDRVLERAEYHGGTGELTLTLNADTLLALGHTGENGRCQP